MANMKNYKMPDEETAKTVVEAVNAAIIQEYPHPQAEVKKFDGDYWVYVPWYIQNQTEDEIKRVLTL